MRVAVLGPLEVEGEGSLGPRDRVVLTALAAQPGTVVSGDQLASALWGEAPPPSWNKVVQGCVVRIRKSLGQSAVETHSYGYRLTMAPADIDSCQFERALARAGEHLAVGQPERALHEVNEALALWRGSPLVEIAGWEGGRTAARHLEDLRMHAEEVWLDASLGSGPVGEVLLSAAEASVEAAPQRARRWELLAIAQHRAGRQDDAEQTLREARGVLGRDAVAAVGTETHAPDEEATPAAAATEPAAGKPIEPVERTRQRRPVARLVVGVAIVVVVALAATVAGVLVVDRLHRAEEEARIAEARRLSAEAVSASPLDRALLMSVEAVRLLDSPETRGNLLTTIGRSTRLAAVIRSQGGALRHLEVAPSGTRALVVGALGEVTQYDLSGRQAIVSLNADGFSYTAATFAPGGSEMAVSWMADSCRFEPCTDFGISVLDAGDPRVRRNDYAGLSAPAVDIAYSPDGLLIAAAPAFVQEGSAGKITVWRVDEPTQPLVQLSLSDPGIDLRVVPGASPPGHVMFSPDGTQIYASGAGDTVAFDLATGEPTRVFEGLGALALSPDGATLAIRASSDTVVLRDTATGTARAALNGGGALLSSAAFSADGARVATATVDGTVRVWDVATGGLVHELAGLAGAALDVAFSADGSRVVTAGADGSIFVWVLGSNAGLTTTLVDPLMDSSTTSAVIVSPTASSVVVIADRVVLTDLESNRATELAVGEQEVASAAFSQDGLQLVTVGWDGTTQLWDAASGALLLSRPGRGYANFGAVAFTADDTGIVVAEADGRVVELDARTLEATGRSITVGLVASGIRTAIGGIVAVTWSPADPADGSEVVFADIATGLVTHRAHLASWSVRAAFSADGSRFAAGGFDGGLEVLDVATGQVVARSESVHAGPVTGLSFSPDGTTLASIGSAGDLVLSEGADAQPRATITPGEVDRQGGISFLPDGNSAVIGAGDGSVIVLETNAAAWVQHVCRVVGNTLTDAEWQRAFGDVNRGRTCQAG